MTIKCVSCLNTGKEKDAICIYRGFSFCKKHLTEYVNNERKALIRKSKLNLSKISRSAK